MIMVTFTKLFVINIVARRRSESPNRALHFSSEDDSVHQYHSESEGVSEKKAISEAEAKPEASRSTPASAMAIIAEIEGVFTVIPLKMSANWLK